MTRARFSTVTKERRRRASLRDALLFDLHAPESRDEVIIAEQRIEHLNHIPILIALAHAFAALALLVNVGMNWTIHATLMGAIIVDLGAWLLMKKRTQLHISPHIMMRLITVYVALVWAIWVYLGATVDDGTTADSHNLHILFGCIGAIMTVTAISSPPVAVFGGLVAITGLHVFIDNRALTAGAAVLALGASGYAIANARTMIAIARRRFVLDEKAHQALRFVTEFESTGRGWFWETDADGTLNYVSGQLANDFGCSTEDLLGRQFTDLISADDNDDELREERTLSFHLSAKFPFSDMVVKSALENEAYWSISGNPIFGDRGRFLGFRGIGNDLTEQRRSEQEISRLARFDSLTSLPNRAMMRQTLDEALRNAARRQKGCALFLIDLDRFKNVNDTLGHPVGDSLLRQVAERLTSVMGNHGQVGRLGGDEFKAVLPGIVETGLLESLAKTMIEQVSRPYDVDGHHVTIGASIGIAIGDPGRSCGDSLTRNADLALYAAKAAGRGQHCFFEPSMHSEASDRQILENELRGAIDREELSMVYQPIVRAAGEDVCGFESMIRWEHPSRGFISPEKFIPIAEECGLIGKIGAWVLDQAIAEAATWPDEIRIAINLSPIQFNDPKIVEIVAGTLQKHRLRAERLELEITEGVFLADSSATDETFARLKALGVRLALDDFGTGYSSLGYLKKAPFDKIKIDQSFVRGASITGSRNGAIIKAIVTLAESLGMDTTAEGVETFDDLALIRDLGCSQIQGYIFGKPAPAEKARELAESATVEPDGYSSQREPRQRLMRRAIMSSGGQPTEVRLRNISLMGALVEGEVEVRPGQSVTLDIVGVGPVVGEVRWATQERFGMKFDGVFDMARLAPKKQRNKDAMSVAPSWHANYQAEVAEGE
ncbi:putative bifunctional diguanylate cyclase/phosphodiesterase [Sphingomicrobium lutaoense]|uniref:Diguanylate cyclase (GGDEF)-like protein/PAS domain S-box-containing protein n=1 Tax=Sphingomicrobium lutaoense TaxID=515949 RepID=A0A839Z0U4_9SPHN|nr:EAL domain-containing protein [Sphingomicrobium lutaoense]MBB3763293.1 diguanylate cyclase (GGDEF)-like protein/PAS domain S-box-containing protein [Sphingomicrobium lutaoense]